MMWFQGPRDKHKKQELACMLVNSTLWSTDSQENW